MKRGTICFLLILLASITVSFAFSSIEQSGFWVNSFFTLILYFAYYGVLHFTVRLDGKGHTAKEILAEYKISFKIKSWEVFTLVLLGCVCICSFLLVQAASIDIFKIFGGVGFKKNLNEAVIISNWTQYLVCIVTLAFLPAVIEELIFRGVIFGELRKYGKLKAVVASALLFAFFHMNPAQTVYQFVLGLVFASLVVVSGNMFLSMILHFINNFLIITYTFIAGSDSFAFSWGARTIITTVILAILGCFVIVRLVKIFAKKDEKQNFDNKRFAAFNNLGYFICILSAGVLWTLILIT